MSEVEKNDPTASIQWIAFPLSPLFLWHSSLFLRFIYVCVLFCADIECQNVMTDYFHSGDGRNQTTDTAAPPVKRQKSGALFFSFNSTVVINSAQKVTEMNRNLQWLNSIEAKGDWRPSSRDRSENCVVTRVGSNPFFSDRDHDPKILMFKKDLVDHDHFLPGSRSRS